MKLHQSHFESQSWLLPLQAGVSVWAGSLSWDPWPSVSLVLSGIALKRLFWLLHARHGGNLLLPWLFMLIMQLLMLEAFVSMEDCSRRPSSSCFIIEVEGNEVLCWKSLTIVVWIEARKFCCCSCCCAASGTLWRIWNHSQLLSVHESKTFRRLTFLWPST